MNDVITVAQLEHLLGVEITINLEDNNSFSGIHIFPGDTMAFNLTVLMTGKARR